MGKKIKPKHVLGSFAVKWAQNRARNDPEFLADITRAFLKKHFQQITTNDLLQCYENKEDLTQYVNMNMTNLKKYAEQISLKTSEIKELIEKYMPEFEIEWIIIWWRKDHKHLYAALMNQPEYKREDMKDWIVAQVENLTKTLLSKL